MCGVENLDGGESTVGGIAGGEPENLRESDGYGHILGVGLVHGRLGIAQSRRAADGGGDRDFQLLELSLASHGRRFHVVGGLCAHRRLDDDEFFGRWVDVCDGISHSTALVACEQLVEVYPTLAHCIGSTHIEGEPSSVRGRNICDVTYGRGPSCGFQRDLGEKGTRHWASLVGQDSGDRSLVFFIIIIYFNFICVLRLLLIT